MQIAHEEVNADVPLSVEGAMCKNLPASAVESVNNNYRY